MKKSEIPGIKEQIKALAALKDEDIDFSDIPEIQDFAGFERGKFFRPIKKPVTLRLDADVLEWFKRRHPKYQTAINVALRRHIRMQN
jgi:uncharacterized protein (DUF4415 family)